MINWKKVHEKLYHSDAYEGLTAVGAAIAGVSAIVLAVLVLFGWFPLTLDWIYTGKWSGAIPRLWIVTKVSVAPFSIGVLLAFFGLALQSQRP
jgi:hypothetical protein